MKQSPLLILFLWVAAIGAVVWLFVWPAFQEVLATQHLLSVERQKLEVLRTAQSDVEAAVAQFVALDEELKEPVMLAAPAYPNEHDVAVLLNQLAQESGLLVSRLTVEKNEQDGEEADPEGSVGSVSAVLLSEGSYEALKQFLRSSETSLRIFDPQRILIEENQQEDSESVGPPLRIEVTGRAYFIHQDE